MVGPDGVDLVDTPLAPLAQFVDIGEGVPRGLEGIAAVILGAVVADMGADFLDRPIVREAIRDGRVVIARMSRW